MSKLDSPILLYGTINTLIFLFFHEIAVQFREILYFELSWFPDIIPLLEKCNVLRTSLFLKHISQGVETENQSLKVASCKPNIKILAVSF